VTGHVTNQGPGGASLIALGLAGQGTVAATTQVRLSALLPSGQLQVLAQAAVNAGGSFAIQAPSTSPSRSRRR